MTILKQGPHGESPPKRLVPSRRPIKSRTADDRLVGRRLHAWAVAQSRRPRLYAELGVADTPQGRYEALTAFVILMLERLGPASPPGQAVFDAYIADLDGALREMGVGDLAMAKRMKALAQGFYGRAAAWRVGLAALPDESDLLGLLRRTLLSHAQDPPMNDEGPADLARHLLATRDWLAARDPLDASLPDFGPAAA